jgi:hypothetical protein
MPPWTSQGQRTVLDSTSSSADDMNVSVLDSKHLVDVDSAVHACEGRRFFEVGLGESRRAQEPVSPTNEDLSR